MLSRRQFDEYAAQGYNRIPLVREVLADMETPLSVFRKLTRNQPFSYLLESVHGGETWGRYSIIGPPCKRRLEVFRCQVCEINGEHRDTRETDQPLEAVQAFLRQFRSPPLRGLPRFSGGLVGYFGYETVRHIEPHLSQNHRAALPAAPDMLWLLSEQVAVFDNLHGRLLLIHHADPAEAKAYDRGAGALTELLDRLQAPLPPDEPPAKTAPAEINYAFPRAEFEYAVERCREYIRAGDVFQVALSQQMSRPFTAPALDLYRALRTTNPSPYLYYVNAAPLHIVGSSPEILVRLNHREVIVRPIAGTRPRGADAQADAKLAAELQADPKELAEHLMLLDLGRNDVGRIAEIGSVQVREQMQIERYSHVMHLVSEVVGRLRSELDWLGVIKATFPAGTLSGAPKVRAMEIIEEIEPQPRGVYAGALGYLGWNGNLDLAIAIRTGLVQDNRLYVQAGAGIVADSQPEREWQETLDKGRALFAAAEWAEAGLTRTLGD